MSVPIIGGPVLPPVSGSASSTSPAISLVAAQDSSSTSSAAPLTILQYAQAIGLPQNLLNTQEWADQQFNAVSRAGFYQALLTDWPLIVQLAKEYSTANLGTIPTQVNQNDTNIATVNSDLSTYNSIVSTDQSQVNTLNAAIAAFNAGTLSQTDYNTAVTTYNNYVATRNASGGVTTTQADINTKLPAGSPPMTPQTTTPSVTFLTSAPLSPPAISGSVPTVTAPSPLSTVLSTVTPSYIDLFTIVNFSFFKQVLAPFFQNLSNLKNQDDFSAFLQFILGDSDPTVLAAFIDKKPNLSTNASGGGVGVGPGVGLTSLSLNLSNHLFTSVLDSATFQSENQDYLTALNQQSVTGLLSNPLLLLAQLGVPSGLVALQQLYSSGNNPGTQTESIVVGLSYAQEINSAVAARLNQNLLTSLTSPATSTTGLGGAINNATDLLQLNVAVLTLAQSLGIPSLLGQLLATLPEAASLNIITPQPPFASVFTNSTSTSALQSFTAGYLSKQQNIGSTNANNILNKAINEAINSNQTTNSDVFSNSLQQSLIQQGVTSEAATSTSNVASAYVKSEIQSANVLNQTFTTSSVTTNPLLSNPLALNIITNNGGEVSGRTLRDQLANALVALGSTPSTALNTATQAITGGNPTVPVTTQEQLSTQIYNQVLASTQDLGTQKSQQLAQQVSTLAVSLGNQIGTHITSLNNLQDTNVSNGVNDTLRSFLAPTLELSTLGQRLRDPANTLLLCAQTGLMYTQMTSPASPIPQKGGSGLDVLV
ncbi:MAG: hypothetical protein WCG42_02350 [Parachlamydiaceae bacterium]